MVPVPPMIEIDHIVYSKNSGMSVGDLETVNVQGSDHFALLGTLGDRVTEAGNSSSPAPPPSFEYLCIPADNLSDC